MKKDQLLKISDLAQFGFSQISFLKHNRGEYERGQQMVIGSQKHQEIEDTGEKISPEETLNLIRGKESSSFLEFLVFDKKHGTVGVLDGAEFSGFDDEFKRNLAIVIERKFTRSRPFFYDSYKIQMAGYALALENDKRFDGLVKVIGGRLELNRMDDQRGKVIETVSMDAMPKDLWKWTECVPELTKMARDLISGKLEPQPLKYSVDWEEWVESKFV